MLVQSLIAAAADACGLDEVAFDVVVKYYVDKGLIVAVTVPVAWDWRVGYTYAVPRHIQLRFLNCVKITLAVRQRAQRAIQTKIIVCI